MEVLAFILRAIEPIGASVWPARPACLSRTCRANRAHDFARVFRVRLLCRVVDTEALRDRCGRCRALDCSQDSGASEFLNLSSQHRATDTAVEFGVVTTDIHGNGRFTVVVGPIASGTYALEFDARNGAGCGLTGGGGNSPSICEADFQSPGPKFGTAVVIIVPDARSAPIYDATLSRRAQGLWPVVSISERCQRLEALLKNGQNAMLWVG